MFEERSFTITWFIPKNGSSVIHFMQTLNSMFRSWLRECADLYRILNSNMPKQIFLDNPSMNSVTIIAIAFVLQFP